MEDALHARIDLVSDAVMVEGSEESIARVTAHISGLRGAAPPGNRAAERRAERDAAPGDGGSSGDAAQSGGQRKATFGRDQADGAAALDQPAAVCRGDRTGRHGIRHRPGRNGKNVSGRGDGGAALLAKKVSRIVLVRPAVEAGERLGFLPGTLQEKVDPYLRPLYDALYDLLEPDRVDKMLERNVIEVAPLAFMRGRTLNDAFIIMDEAQNTTSEQMKMFLTRMGNNAKAVITGDITQIDLPNPRKSGLVEAINILDGVDGIRFIHFEDGDVVRHHLVQRIIRAYEGFGRGQQELPLAIDGEDEVRFSQPQ